VIARGYAHNMDRKLLTAERVLRQAAELIKTVARARISIDPSVREGAPIIPLEILKQKYLFHRGLLALTFEDEEKAIKKFEKCITTGTI